MNNSRTMTKMTWKEFETCRRENDLIIIPTGACEVYGGHLPMGTDSIAVEALAEMTARRLNAIAAPCLPIADSSMLAGFPGTLSIAPELFSAWTEQIIENFISYGFKHFLFLTGHGANVAPITSIARRYQQNREIEWAQIDFWRFTELIGTEIFEGKGQMAHGHASECATSIMLYLDPDLVDLNQASMVVPQAAAKEREGFLSFIPFNQRTPDGTLGNAKAGTAEKGRMILEECVRRIEAFVKEAWG